MEQEQLDLLRTAGDLGKGMELSDVQKAPDKQILGLYLMMSNAVLTLVDEVERLQVNEEYEYKVQHQNLLSRFQGWSDSGLNSWKDETTALKAFKLYVEDERRMTEETGRKDYNYRIVRRPKDAETVYRVEEES